MMAIVARRPEAGAEPVAARPGARRAPANGAARNNPLWHSLATAPGGSPIQARHAPPIQRMCSECAKELEQEVQPKLTVGAPGDAYEREADAVADKVMRMPAHPSSSARDGLPFRARPLAGSLAQRQFCGGATGEEIQAKSDGTLPDTPLDSVRKVVSAPGSGAPLPGPVRERIEPVLGADLSGVRVHSDRQSRQAAGDINAKAFTNRNNIYLGANQSSDDVSLMAHEATHVVQQAGGAGIAVQRNEGSQTSTATAAGASCVCGTSAVVSYDAETLRYIRSIRGLIRAAANDKGVPIVAVAGCIADEYNTRRGHRVVLDGVQDAVLDSLFEFQIDVDRFLDIDSKLLNALENDVGTANINVRTALGLVESGELSVPGSPQSDPRVAEIIDFLLTDRGTARTTAAVVARAQTLFGPLLAGYPDALREAVLVSYFKQGNSYYYRAMMNRALHPGHEVCPGDGGCCVMHNRTALIAALT